MRDKIFAGLSEEGVGYVKLTAELQAGLIGARPEAFFAASGAWGRKGWTHLRLAQVTSAELKELLAEAFRLVAPKRLHGAPAGRPRAKAAGKSRSTTRRAQTSSRFTGSNGRGRRA